MWDDAVFRLLNEARRFATKEQPTSAVAPTLASMLDQGFVATQILAVSRLVDKRKDVISLRRLLDDIEAHRHLVTREMFVCHDGLPYNAAAAERAFWAKAPRPTTGVVTMFLPTEGPEAFDTAERGHRAFDALSEKAPADRSRTDTIQPAMFDGIRALLEDQTVTSLVELRHKFVAHAADELSRRRAGIERFGVTLNGLEAAQRSLVQAAQRIELDLLWGSSRGVVPVPQHDHLRYLDLPFAPADRLQELRDWWQRHCEAREEWTSARS